MKKKQEKEIIETKGWLKPSRLISVTGPLASNELAKKIEEEKRDERIKQRAIKMNDESKKIKGTSKYFKLIN